MRSIKKFATPGLFHLEQAHCNPPQTADDAESRWRSFRKNKQAVLERLLEEQYQLCCYSELRADLEGLGYHIEHVKNKSQHPQHTFDYGNLAASALHSTEDLGTFRTQQLEIFGGHASGKRQAVDMLLFISCHQPDCARFFAYLSDGRVVAAQCLEASEQAKATYTIELLNLNSPFLIVRRQRWWSELEILFEEHIAEDMNLECLAGIDLVPINQKLSPFFSLTRQFFGKIAEHTLQQHAPDLG